MMTSSNGNIFRVTGHLCGEFPAQRPVTRSFDVFFDLRLNKRLSKQWWGWGFETLSRPLWRLFNDLSILYQLLHVYCSEVSQQLVLWYIKELSTATFHRRCLHLFLADLIKEKNLIFQYYSDVRSAWKCLKSPTNRFFVHQFVYKANHKGNINAQHTGLKGISQCVVASQNAENCALAWPHVQFHSVAPVLNTCNVNHTLLSMGLCNCYFEVIVFNRNSINDNNL